MNILLVGVSCVGKTTIGKLLAENLCCKFFDLDREIEKFFQKSIERLKSELFTEYSFRKKGAFVLHKILTNDDNHPCIIALPPSGLKDRYYNVIRKAKCITIVIRDTPKNILSRITFYDRDSKPLRICLDESQRVRYLKTIKEDIRYFNTFYKRADREAHISGLTIEECVQKIKTLIYIS